MRALQVIDKSFLGGGQTVVRNLIEGFRGTGVEASLACRDGGPLVAAVRALGAPVTPIAFDKRFRPGPALALARTARRQGVAVVHAHGLVAAFYCVLARSCFGMRVPLVYHQHGFHHHNYGRATVGARRAAERAVCRRVDRVIACSRADAEQLLAGGYAGQGSLRLIRYGVPEPQASLADIDAARAEAHLESGQPAVGTVARLHPQKGVDVFLRAAALVRDQVPGVAFVVVGGGELEEELHRLAAQVGLNGELRWMGGRPSGAFLASFSVNVLSSRWEGLPFTLLEAMASARPIVTTDVPGCLEAVGPAEAEIVPRDDPPALAAGILRLLRDPAMARAHGLAARKRFDAEFTLKQMVQRVEDLYAEVAR